jgi:MFS family permease
MSTDQVSGTPVVRSLVPARIDRLPWASFHTRMVLALGIAWVLDGLEITMAASIGPRLESVHSLNLSTTDIGWALGTVYLIGEVVGALFFGYLADRLGRRKLFILTLGVYLIGSGLTAFSWDLWSFVFFRFIAGMGIGGEYAAINSAIDEMIPAKYRGRTDLMVNGTYWLGAIFGTLGTFVLLDPTLLGEDVGWRVALATGPIIGILIWQLRRNLPESPRWQLTHGQAEEAEKTIAAIEREVEASGVKLPPLDESKAIEVRPEKRTPLLQVVKTLFARYPDRSLLSAALLITQSFLYNAIFFTQAQVLVKYYGVPDETVPMYFFAFAFGNLLGPFVLGKFFDTIGRRRMISSTYIASGLLLALSGYMFSIGVLNATTQTIFWSVIFFIASAAASSAYLTVSEIFPIELRGQAISFFFAAAQIVGATGPLIFTQLIGNEANPARDGLFYGYLVGAGIMILGGVIAAIFGVDAEQKSLEDVAAPLTAVKTSEPKTTAEKLGEMLPEGTSGKRPGPLSRESKEPDSET